MITRADARSWSGKEGKTGVKKQTVYQGRGCSIFSKILYSLLLVLLAEVLLLTFAISTSRVTS